MIDAWQEGNKACQEATEAHLGKAKTKTDADQNEVKACQEKMGLSGEEGGISERGRDHHRAPGCP
jgi:hypothetical protein